MTANEPVTFTITPTDELPGTHPPTGRRKVGKRGVRKRILGKGEGDYCIYQIAPNDSDLPRGSLIPIPDIPRFTSTLNAVRWIRYESKDLLAGKQVMVFKALEILNILVQAQPHVVIEAKQRITVTDPTHEEKP